MDLNATLIGQMITFVIFVLFTMKYVWPPITKAMQDREKKIADGLAAGERGQHDLELARKKSLEILQEAKNTANGIIQQAHDRANHVLEEAKYSAKHEADRLILVAHAEIEQQVHKAKSELQQEVANLALVMAEKIVQQQINPATQKQWLDQMINQL